MLYQLPNGKVIEMSTEQFIEMSDEELEYLIAYNYGDVQENPWFGSILDKQDKTELSDAFTELPPDLTDVPPIEKISDLDIDYEENE
jgi:hypothetical protein